MLSEIEQIFPTICTNMKLDIDQIVEVRKNRSKLFNEQYFTNRFWDIILLLYAHEINGLPIDAKAIAKNLTLSNASVLRYLQALFDDDVICAFDGKTEEPVDLANDNLTLTSLGFENVGTIIQQTRRVFDSSTKP